MPCEVAEGWQGRVATKMGIAAAVGAPVCTLLATLHGHPLLRYTLTGTASYVLVMGCFSGAQEMTRLVRCHDGPANSAVGGAATGALLYGLQGGSAPRGAVICAAAAASLHWAADRVDLDGGLRGWLIRRRLLDDDASIALRRRQPEERRAEPAIMVWAQKYLPVRKMSDDEWHEYEAAKAERHVQNVDAVLKGGLPALVQEQQHSHKQAAEK